MYPNPVLNHLFIDADGMVNASVRVVNVMGQQVMASQSLKSTAINQISLEQLSTGFYLVELTVNGKNYPTKIYKQ